MATKQQEAVRRRTVMTSYRYSTKQFYVNLGTVTKRGREWKDIDGRYKQLKHNHRNYSVRTLVVPVVSKC